MAGKTETAEQKGDTAASRAERQEAWKKKQADKAEKAAAAGRPAHLCTLKTVDVKKTPDGTYQVLVTGSAGRRSFAISPAELGPVLRDLETAIHVIRAHQ